MERRTTTVGGWACRLMAAVVAVTATGCGPGWEATAGGTGKGYDVYRPQPYLLVVRAAPAAPAATTRPAAMAGAMMVVAPLGSQQQQYTATIVYLPDYSQRYRVRSTTGGTTILIKDGWQLAALSDQNVASMLLNSAVSAASPAGPGGGAALGLLALAGGPGSAGQPLAAMSAGEADGPPAAAVGPADHPGATLFKIVYDSAGQITALTRVPMIEGPAPRASQLSDGPPPVPPGPADEK